TSVGSSAGAVESPESGTGRRWPGISRGSMLTSGVVIDCRALVSGVDDRLFHAGRALEPVLHRRVGNAAAEVLRADDHKSRSPVHLDALADRGVTGDLTCGNDERGDVGEAIEPIDRAGDQAVVDAAVFDEQKDDDFAGPEGGRDRARRGTNRG